MMLGGTEAGCIAVVAAVTFRFSRPTDRVLDG